jgi:hypothetical protein
MGEGEILKYKSHSTAENLVGFIQIRTCALLERLRRWPQGCSNPCTTISDDADLIVVCPSEQIIYTDILRAVIHKENIVAVVLVVSQ